MDNNLKLYNRIVELLKEKKIEYIETRHQPVRTSEEAAKIRGTKLSEGAKALICEIDTGFIQVVVPGDKLINKKAMQKELDTKKFKLASPETAENLSGVKIGGIPPFGNLFDVPIPVYVSSEVLNNKQIEFNAGDRSISIRINPMDWQNVVNPIVGSYCIHKYALT